MKQFLAELVANSEKKVDSLNVIGVLAALTMFGLSIASYVQTRTFTPITFAGGVATIIGSLGGARRARDGKAFSDPGGTQ